MTGSPARPSIKRNLDITVSIAGLKKGISSPRESVADYDAYLRGVFGFDEPGQFDIWNLGWCEAEFSPIFEEKVIEDRGDHEVVQDFAGRHVLFFKGRRSGYMPEYYSPAR